MTHTFPLRSIEYENRHYRNGLVNIDADRNEVEVLCERRRFLFNRNAPLTKLIYGVDTAVQGPEANIVVIRVGVGDLKIEPEDPRDAQTIADLVTAPQREAFLLMQQDLRRVEDSIRGFLTVRMQIFEQLAKLKARPREALLKDYALPLDPGDPFEAVFGMQSERLRNALGDLRSALGVSSTHLPPATLQHLYAATYGIGLAQDAVFSGNVSVLESVASLFSKMGATPNPSIHLTSQTVDAITNTLLDQAVRAIESSLSKGPIAKAKG